MRHAVSSTATPARVAPAVERAAAATYDEAALEEVPAAIRARHLGPGPAPGRPGVSPAREVQRRARLFRLRHEGPVHA